MIGADPPDWRLPEGVNRSLWEYSRSERLAAEEDSYFGDHPLFRADVRAVDDRLDPGGGPVVDLGCGAGRMSIHLGGRGFEVVAVDLSAPMLGVVRRKAEARALRVRCVRANLCRLGCFADASFSAALSMFSTLGMIRTPSARRAALAEAARVLRPGGLLILHAHNFWLNLRDLHGLGWIAAQGWAGLRSRPGAGDRSMTYRGIPGMEVHLYRWPELRREVRSAGLRIEEAIPIDAETARTIPAPAILPGLRAGGWLVVARAPGPAAPRPGPDR